MYSRSPIGIFDSGVGGLTVVKELIRRLPGEDIVYFGDTARVPYGAKSRHTVMKFSVENALFLLKYNVKLIIVACNTSSSVALAGLRRNFKVPIVGVIEPGVIDAASSTKNGRIGIIGTATTIRSQAYERRIKRHLPHAKVFSQSCPLFVPLAEEGWLSKAVTLDVIRDYLSPIKQKGIDTLILGCTHYPLLKKSIRKIIGKKITIIDSAISTTKAVKTLLVDQGLGNQDRRRGRLRFFVTDEPGRFKRVGERFLGRRLEAVRKVGHGL